MVQACSQDDLSPLHSHQLAHPRIWRIHLNHNKIDERKHELLSFHQTLLLTYYHH